MSPEQTAACTHDFHWFCDYAQEQGWKCVCCKLQPGEPPGFSPAHDREFLGRKVGGVLFDLNEADIVYVGSGCNGDAIESVVVDRCRREDAYDQGSIARFILETMAGGSHAEYWRKVSTDILAGKDSRNRCACGALSTCSSGKGDGTWLYTCSAHPPPLWNDDPPKKKRKRATRATT